MFTSAHLCGPVRQQCEEYVLYRSTGIRCTVAILLTVMRASELDILGTDIYQHEENMMRSEQAAYNHTGV